MSRARNIKPGTMENEALAALPPLHRLLWIYMWMLADREGRLEDRPRRIKATALPYDEADVDAMLDDLHDSGFVVRYEVGGKRYLQIVNFAKHQNPHPNERESGIPPVPEGERLPAKGESTSNHDANNFAPKDEALSTCDISTRADSLIPDSPIPDSPIPDSERSSRGLRLKPREKIDSRGSRLPDAWRLPDEWSQWAARECGLSPPQVRETAECFADYWHAKAGSDACKRDWFATWRNWCRKDRTQHRAQGPPHGASSRNGASLWSLDDGARNALARELGVGEARPGESMQAYIARIQAAQTARDRLH